MTGNGISVERAPACPRYPSLDLWRGVACLLVVVNHSAFRQPAPATGAAAWEWAGYGLGEIAAYCWIGVPIFFVISGYCISATADSSRRKSIGYVPFAARRVRRIFPPYLICLGTTAALVAAAELLVPGSIVDTDMACMLRPWWYTWSQWLGNITLTELWRYHFFGSPKSMYLGHAWTLCYEEQFYAVMGLLILLSGRRLFAACLVVTIACPLIQFACHRNDIPIDGFFFDGQWTLFAFGVLVYYALNYALLRGQLLAAAVLVLAIGYASRDPLQLLQIHKNFEQSLFVAAAFALILILMRRPDDWLMSRVWLRPVIACGIMCYSLYLVHLPVVVFLHAAARQCQIDPKAVTPLVTIPIGIACSIAVAWMFYQLVERRFLNTSPLKLERTGDGEEPRTK